MVLVFVVGAGPSNTFPAWIKRACSIPPAASQSPFNFSPQSPEPGCWPRLALPAHAHLHCHDSPVRRLGCGHAPSRSRDGCSRFKTKQVEMASGFQARRFIQRPAGPLCRIRDGSHHITSRLLLIPKCRRRAGRCTSPHARPTARHHPGLPVPNKKRMQGSRLPELLPRNLFHGLARQFTLKQGQLVPACSANGNCGG